MMTASTRSCATSMAESPYRKRQPSETVTVPPDDGGDEILLARRVAWGLPLVTVAGAITVGVVSSAGPAILVMVAGGILATIAALWASVRTLTGDAPVDPEMLIPLARIDTTGALERKQRVLRALKDLEHEHSVGKIDDADYETLSAQYRADAKRILREIDAEVGPHIVKAEEIALAHLEKRGLTPSARAAEQTAEQDEGDDALVENDENGEGGEDDDASRRACPKCETANDPDATFCKSCGSRLAATAGDDDTDDEDDDAKE